MSRNIILKLSIINLLVAIASCSNKNEELKKAIENVKVAYSDSIYFEISENNDSTFTPQQSLVLWYWDDSTVMFNIRPDSLNIQEDRPWLAGAVKPEIGHRSIKYNGIEHESIEYITYSKNIKLGLKLNISDTSLASLRVISDSTPEIIPSSGVMIRNR